MAADNTDTADARNLGIVPDPETVGGESASVVQVANLIYAGTKTSECFADHFLRRAEQDSSISTSRRLHSVKLASDEIYNFPLLDHDGRRQIRAAHRRVRQLAPLCRTRRVPAGLRRLLVHRVEPELSPRDGEDFYRSQAGKARAGSLVFHTVYDINELQAKHGKPQPLEGIHSARDWACSIRKTA